MALTRFRNNKFKTDFTKEHIEKLFHEYGPLHSILLSHHFSLAWFVEKVMCNVTGKPLRLLPFQRVMLNTLWYKKFPFVICSRGAGKTFILALYALLKAILSPGSKIVIVGAGYRQAKLVFNEIRKIYEASPILQESLGQWGGPKYGSDSATFKIGTSSIIAIPIGDGEKVRGLRATNLLCDEMGSIPEETFEIVLAPFTAVHLDPAQKVINTKFINRLKKLGATQDLIDAIYSTQDFGNQVVMSGTGTPRGNHFHKRYKVYRSFIDSMGDTKLLKRALEEQSIAMTGKPNKIPNDEIEKMSRSWRQYSIIQLPYNGLPEGFLDDDAIRSARASMAPHRFAMEFGAEFPEDTDGFIKRSWIDRATPRFPDAIPVCIELFGDPKATYVLGLDPARWNDNFGAVVLKLTSRGKELVYCTSWNRTEHNKSAEYIREICRRFNIAYIAMDKGGGGDAVLEWLCKKQPSVKENELLWPVPDQIENKADLAAPGRKIIDLVNFISWSTDAAHNLESSIQQCNLLFPYKGDDNEALRQYKRYYKIDEITNINLVKEELAKEMWGIDEWEADANKQEQTLGAFNEVNECINEVCAIIRDTTEGGTERFILPKISSQPEGTDTRRRDRFSALMLANYAAKVYLGHGHKPTNSPGVATDTQNKRRRGHGRIRQRGQVRY